MFKDLTGKVFGSFLAIEPTNRINKKQQKFWKCKCLICGKYYEVRGDNLRLGGATKWSRCQKNKGWVSNEIV